MQQEGNFKTTTFGGFDKQSVLTYIDTLTEQFHLSEQEYRSQLEGFSKAQASQVTYIQKLETQLSDADGKLEAVAAQLEAERASALDRRELDQAFAKTASLEQQCQRQAQLLEQQREAGRQQQYKMEALEFKSKKYDDISVEVGDALLVAKQNADQLVSQARQEADRLLADARIHADEIASEAQSRMERFYMEMGSFKGDSTRLRKSIEEILFVLNDRIDVMQEVVGQIEKRNNFTPATLEYTQDSQPFERPTDDAGLFGSVLPVKQDENA